MSAERSPSGEAPHGELPETQRLPNTTSGDGLHGYMSGMEMLQHTTTPATPRSATASELRRHTTGRGRAIEARTPPRAVPLVPHSVLPWGRTPNQARTFSGLALLVALCGTLWLHVTQNTTVIVPAWARGEWVATDLRYAGRRLDIGSDHLTLHVGTSSAPIAQRIVRARSREGEGVHVLELDYLDGSHMQHLELRIVDSTPPHLTLRHPADVMWVRRGAPISHTSHPPIEVPVP